LKLCENKNIKVDTPFCFIKIYDFNLFSYLNRFLATESYSPMNILKQYYGNSTKPGANLPFNFGLLAMDRANLVELIELRIKTWLDNLPENQVANWVVSILKCINV